MVAFPNLFRCLWRGDLEAVAQHLQNFRMCGEPYESHSDQLTDTTSPRGEHCELSLPPRRMLKHVILHGITDFAVKLMENSSSK